MKNTEVTNNSFIMRSDHLLFNYLGARYFRIDTKCCWRDLG